MAQLSDDCFAFGGALLPLDDARAHIIARYGCALGSNNIALVHANRRVLAGDFVSPMNLPPETNSAVDGYAVHHADLAPATATELLVMGRAAAGHPHTSASPRGQALRIFTGAVVPVGPDTIMMQEDCTETPFGVLIQPGIKRGANLRQAGEDVTAGTIALTAGTRLSPADLALLAGLGQTHVVVRAPLRVALFSTGDELANAPGPLRAGQVYDANRIMLTSLLDRRGATVIDGGILPDDPAATVRAFRAANADLIITSGGVSAGEEDHVRTAITAAGTLEFWRVAIKPGRPVALGRVGNTPLLGLPGNPVAALVTLATVGQPLLDRLSGAIDAPPLRFHVTSDFAYRKKSGRREYVRVQLRDGRATRFPKEGAGIITSLTGSDALLELPEAMTDLAPGDIVRCIPLGLIYG